MTFEFCVQERGKERKVSRRGLDRVGGGAPWFLPIDLGWFKAMGKVPALKVY